MATLGEWKSAWEGRDPDRFLDHYASSMTTGDGRAWANTKRRNILDKSWIKVQLQDVSLFLYPGGNMAYTEFTQRYDSDKLAGVSQKRLYWRQEAGKWRIALEKAIDTPSPTQIAQR